MLDADAGAIGAWVRTPLLSGVEAELPRLYLYYGNGSASGRPVVDSPWPAAGAGIWHLDEDPTDRSAPQFLDNSQRENHLNTDDTHAPSPTDGKAGRSVEFDGAGDWVFIADPPDGSLDFDENDSFTVSCWVHVSQSLGGFDGVFAKGGEIIGSPGYLINLGTANWNGFILDSANEADAYFGEEGDFVDDWVHLALVVDRAASRLISFASGAARDDMQIDGYGSLANARSFEISPQNNPFRGKLDELRIYRDARSSSWISAEHANLADPAFVTVGPTERP